MSNPSNGDTMHEFDTGAVRGTDRNGVRYDLLPWVGLRRIAETCAYGAERYGEHNWRLGIPNADLLNHAIAHMVAYCEGDRTEDHLAHAAWNLMVAMDNEERRPAMADGMLGNGGRVTPEILAALDERKRK